jgi:hypothetical protein
MRVASGTWLLIRATQLHGRDGADPRIAVILEPARRAELAPLIVMTDELSISRHTVRDHTKAIFSKLGVSSRPELTAKLYHEESVPNLRVVA